MVRPREFDNDAVLDAAMQCFWTRGYEATSVRDLAESMGIAGPSLYNAFGDKRSLFMLALDKYCNDLMRKRLAELEATGGPREAIEGLFAQIIERSVSDTARRGCLLINSALEVAPHDPEIGRMIGKYIGEIRSFFERNIQSARAAGHVAPTLDSRHTANHLLAVLMGIRVLARARPERTLLTSAANAALETLGPAPNRRATWRSG